MAGWLGSPEGGTLGGGSGLSGRVPSGGGYHWMGSGDGARTPAPAPPPPAQTTVTPAKAKPSAVQNFISPLVGAAKGIGEGLVHAAGTPVEGARVATAALTGNQKAEQAAKSRAGTDIQAAEGMLQAVPRTVAQTAISPSSPLNLSPEKHILGANRTYQPKGTAQQLLFGKEPIQSFANAYEQGKQQGGVAGGLGAETANVAGGLLTLAGAKGGVKAAKEAPLTKEATGVKPTGVTPTAKPTEQASQAKAAPADSRVLTIRNGESGKNEYVAQLGSKVSDRVGRPTGFKATGTSPHFATEAEANAWLKSELNKPTEPTVDEAKAGSSETPPATGLTPQAKTNLTMSTDTTPTSKTAIGQNIRAVVAPATTSQAAHDAALAVRGYKGATARVASQEAARGDKAFKAFDAMPTDQHMAEISNYERTGKFATEPTAGYSEMYRQSTDASKKTLQDVYQNNDLGNIQNYVRRNWVFDNPAEEDKAVSALYGAGRSLRPSTSNLKQRVLTMPVEDAQKVLEARGIQARLAVSNPELLRRQAVVGAEQARGYRDLGNALKEQGAIKFVKMGDRIPETHRPLSDRAFQVLYPGEVKFHEAYDAKVMSGLRSLVRDLKVTHKRELSLTGSGSRRMGSDTLGVSFLPVGKFKQHMDERAAAKAAGETPPKHGPAGEVHTKFGTPETVLTHELGHEMDRIYGIKGNLLSDVKTVKTVGLDGEKRVDYTGANGQTYKELVALAQKRGFGKNDPYAESKSEMIANLVHAYVHAPELLDAIAPTAKARLDTLIDNNPELQQLRDIKPSLQVTSNEMTKNIGMVHGGQYVAPHDVARVLDNAVLRGLEGHAIFRGVRNVKNSINMLNLGISAFHAGTTSINASISDMVGGLRKAFTGSPVRGAGQFARGFVPGASITRQVIKGSKAFKELANSDPLVANELTKMIDPSGFRLKQDQGYRISMNGTVRNAVANGDWRAAAARGIPTVIEKASAPIMEHLVPNAKLGAFLDRAQRITEEHTGTETELADKLAKASDSIDNIYGQLAYDNLFWNKTFKDLAMLSQRSLGWNLGTVREVGGGLVDMKNIYKTRQVTDRTLYALSLPVLVGAYGAAYEYMHTGHGPQSPLDYFYPKTGGTDPNGNPERVALPSYMKDVISYSKNPVHTVLNKLSPIIDIPESIVGNRDYFGNMVRNPQDPLAQQLEQVGAYVAKNMLPFSVTNQLQRTSHGLLSQAENAIGITPAPASVSRTAFANRVLSLYGQQLNQGPQTPEQQKVSADKLAARNQILSGKGQGLLDKMVASGEMSKSSEKSFLASSKDTSVQRAFGGLSMANKWKVLQNAKPADLAQIGDLKQIEVQAGSTLNSKTATEADRSAAESIIKQFGGNVGDYQAQAKAATRTKAAATRKANALAKLSGK